MFAYSPVSCGNLYLVFVATAVILVAIIIFLLEKNKVKSWFNANPEDPNDRKKLNRFNQLAVFLIILALLAVFLTPYNPNFQALSRYNFLYAICIENQ